MLKSKIFIKENPMNNVKQPNFNKEKIITLGAGIIGLIATSENFVGNQLAQQIGLYSAIVGAIGMGTILWKWAAEEDRKHGRTLASEFNEIKTDVKNVFAKVKGVTDQVRQEFADEYPSVPKEDTANVTASSARKLRR